MEFTRENKKTTTDLVTELVWKSNNFCNDVGHGQRRRRGRCFSKACLFPTARLIPVIVNHSDICIKLHTRGLLVYPTGNEDEYYRAEVWAIAE